MPERTELAQLAQSTSRQRQNGWPAGSSSTRTFSAVDVGDDSPSATASADSRVKVINLKIEMHRFGRCFPGNGAIMGAFVVRCLLEDHEHGPFRRGEDAAPCSSVGPIASRATPSRSEPGGWGLVVDGGSHHMPAVLERMLAVFHGRGVADCDRSGCESFDSSDRYGGAREQHARTRWGGAQAPRRPSPTR